MQAPGADLNSLVVFNAVAESGGFTAAAERLGLTKARVSTVVRRLELALGVSLFSRTTRRVALTLRGAGISAMNRLSAEEALRNGQLVRLLPEWSLPRSGIFAVYPPGRQIPAAARSFVAFYQT
jgi:DNA-binding transcriptional LysR family regulator